MSNDAFMNKLRQNMGIGAHSGMQHSMYGSALLGGAILKPLMTKAQRDEAKAIRRAQPEYKERYDVYEKNADKIKAGATAARKAKYDELKAWYDNFTGEYKREPTGQEIKVKRAEINLARAMQAKARKSTRGQTAAALAAMTPEKRAEYAALGKQSKQTQGQKDAQKRRNRMKKEALGL